MIRFRIRPFGFCLSNSVQILKPTSPALSADRSVPGGNGSVQDGPTARHGQGGQTARRVLVLSRSAREAVRPSSTVLPGRPDHTPRRCRLPPDCSPPWAQIRIEENVRRRARIQGSYRDR